MMKVYNIFISMVKMYQSAIRVQRIAEYASKVAAIGVVREKLVEMQRNIAEMVMLLWMVEILVQMLYRMQRLKFI